jgi:hypothetical protein
MDKLYQGNTYGITMDSHCRTAFPVSYRDSCRTYSEDGYEWIYQPYVVLPETPLLLHEERNGYHANAYN